MIIYVWVESIHIFVLMKISSTVYIFMPIIIIQYTRVKYNIEETGDQSYVGAEVH